VRALKVAVVADPSATRLRPGSAPSVGGAMVSNTPVTEELTQSLIGGKGKVEWKPRPLAIGSPIPFVARHLERAGK
jgi:hypothetical protein